MSSFTPASPGENAKKRVHSASWFNMTLETGRAVQDMRRDRRRFMSPPREGELYCEGEDNTAERFNPVGISTFAGIQDDYLNRTPRVSSTNVDEWNWVIPQEQMKENAPVLCVVSGLTRAWVTTVNADDQAVIYDPAQSKLITAREGKAQILIKGDTTFPSLINIGNQPNLIRVRGNLTNQMPGTAANFSIDTLVGINIFASLEGSSISANNIHRFVANAGAVARAEWVMGNNPPRWEIYQVDCP